MTPCKQNYLTLAKEAKNIHWRKRKILNRQDWEVWTPKCKRNEIGSLNPTLHKAANGSKTSVLDPRSVNYLRKE